MVKLQYVSDIHLEQRSKIINIPKISECENICLLGDIGYPNTKIYKEFINYCSKKWENVFLLYGNHEYYSIKNKQLLSMKDIELESISLPDNVYYLDNDCLYLNTKTNRVSYFQQFKDRKDSKDFIKIIGSLLWSDIDLQVSRKINDYKNIYVSVNPDILFTPEMCKTLFNTSKKYIIQELSNDTTPTILLTHHGANLLTNGHYYGNFLSSAYASDIPELLSFNHLIACINGHTHSSIDRYIPNTNIRLLSNCYGYLGESKAIVKYNERSFINI
jgi:predicted MPP superfamily phosphohydrolase